MFTLLNGTAAHPPEEPQHAVRLLLDATRSPLASATSVRDAASALVGADLTLLQSEEEKTAFWLNLYNALMGHILLVHGARGSVTGRFHLFFLMQYRVGPHRLSLQQVEHGILRANARMSPLPWRAFGAADPRRALAVTQVDPRIHFALNCGAVSCPPIRAYAPEALDAQLTLATRAYFADHCRVDAQAGVVQLPYLCRMYAADFGAREELLKFATLHLEGEPARWLHEHAARARVTFGPYDWTLVPRA